MAALILASRSPARLAILRQIGLRPRVIISGASEEQHHGSGCARLVENNALTKACAVAAQIRSGIVIGADTLCYADGRIIGKPASKRDAFETLKLLSRVPQVVYSAAAIVDAATKEVTIVWDKTRVVMAHLEDSQIREYINKVQVEHLAGSFDIQGMGALFVRRIEGCYYNVVGLPLAKMVPVMSRMSLI